MIKARKITISSKIESNTEKNTIYRVLHIVENRVKSFIALLKVAIIYLFFSLANILAFNCRRIIHYLYAV